MAKDGEVVAAGYEGVAGGGSNDVGIAGSGVNVAGLARSWRG